MKSSELIRITQEYGWKLSKQDSTSHREYEKNGRKIIKYETNTCYIRIGKGRLWRIFQG